MSVIAFAICALGLYRVILAISDVSTVAILTYACSAQGSRCNLWIRLMGGLSMSLIVLMRIVMMVAVEDSPCPTTFLCSSIYRTKHSLYIGLIREQYHHQNGGVLAPMEELHSLSYLLHLKPRVQQRSLGTMTW